MSTTTATIKTQFFLKRSSIYGKNKHKTKKTLLHLESFLAEDCGRLRYQYWYLMATWDNNTWEYPFEESFRGIFQTISI